VVEEGRVVFAQRPWRDGIAKTDVHLHRDPRLGQARLEPDTHTSELVRGADFLGRDRVGVEDDAVLGRNRAKVADNRDDVGDAARAPSKEVEVPGGAVARGRPHPEEHRALQDETVRVARGAEAVE